MDSIGRLLAIESLALGLMPCHSRMANDNLPLIGQFTDSRLALSRQQMGSSCKAFSLDNRKPKWLCKTDFNLFSDVAAFNVR